MILLHEVTLFFGGRRVLEGVSFSVPEGHAAAVVGRTGSGKSSLLAAVAAALRLDRGDITVHGHSVRGSPAAVRRIVGYLPSRPPAWPPCRVGEWLQLAAAAAGLEGKPLRLAVAKALDLAGLADRTGDAIDTLPDGSGRRLLLARALLHDPLVLVLDDPFGGLDPVERRSAEQLVGDAHLMGRTVLAALDDAVVPSCFTDVILLRDGAVAAKGAADAAAFSSDLRLAYRLTCRGRAEAAGRVVRGLGAEARAVDLDHVDTVIDPTVLPPARIVAAVVAAGIPVEAAGFQPAWTAQLLG